MEALAALGLAANIAQFVEYAYSLIHGTVEVYNSASGSSDKAEQLENVYCRLSLISSGLSLSGKSQGADSSSDNSTLEDLALRCRDDCEKLLGIVGQLRVKNSGPRRVWDSFQKAVGELLKTREIEILKERIHESRSTMMMHLCTTTSNVTKAMQEQLNAVRAENRGFNSQRSAEIAGVNNILCRIEDQVKSLKSTPASWETNSSQVEMLAERVSGLSLAVSTAKQMVTKQEAILSSLKYHQRHTRHEAIPVAHSETFRWIFAQDTSPTGKMNGRFSRWLRSDNDVFWVTGKPGSGKSTMAKFIADHAQTRDILFSWARPRNLVVATHYFWSAGTRVQRSMEGLLRSLLADILSEAPELTTALCVERWAMPDNTPFKDMPWSLSQLHAALVCVSTLADSPVKVFILIDGLDEYEGDHREISQTLLALSKSKYVKVCIASRPWNVFDDFFGRHPENKLYINELTQPDIWKYASSTLKQHSRWHSISMEMGSPESILNEIAEKSQGVFLWVFLVCRLLVEGMTNYDSISDLRRRLDSLPSDLELFFAHILKSVEPFYHAKMAGSLLMASAALEPLHALIYAFHDMEYDDPEYATNMEPVPLDPKDRFNHIQTIARRLNGRCKGLLELHDDRIFFLHRTVRDFLRTGAMVVLLKGYSKADFNAHFSISSSFVALIKRTQYTEPVIRSLQGIYNDVPFTRNLTHCLRYAAIADDDPENHLSTERLLDELEISIHKKLVTGQINFPILHGHGGRDISTLVAREHYVQQNHIHYIKRKMRAEPSYLQDLDQPALALALCSTLVELGYSQWSTERTPRRLEMLTFLLDNNHNPNESFETQYFGQTICVTPWSNFIVEMMPYEHTHESMYATKNVSAKLTTTIESGIFSLFIRHGADPAVLTHHTNELLLPAWLRFLLLAFTSCNLHRWHTGYLRDLRSFLSVVKDFNIMNHPLVKPRQDVSGADSSTFMTPLQLLCDYIINADTTMTTTLYFLAAVVKELRILMQATDLPWDEFDAALYSTFPESLLLTMGMGSVVHRYHEGADGDSNSRKRRIFTETDDEPRKRHMGQQHN